MKKQILFATLVLLSFKGFTQDTGNDPYAIFGHKSTTKYETTITELLYIKNSDTTKNVRAMAFDMKNGFAFLLDKNDSLIEKVKVEPNKILRWLSVDPKAAKYPEMSPYNAMANNPIRYIDPDGQEIAPASMDEWNRQKLSVTNERDRLQNSVNSLTERAARNGWSAERLAGRIGNMNERIGGLNSSLTNLGTLEASTQVYRLNNGAGEIGGTTYDPASGNVVINFGTTANFVHETTHAGQFETGDIAFSRTNGQSLAQDVQDEVAAYKAQFAYAPSSVSGLTSTSSANSFAAITTNWVQGITASDGSKPYSVGGSANSGIIPININSNRDALIRAYPNAAAVLRTIPAAYTIGTDPNTYIKR